MASFVTFGEAMLRLKSPGHERLFQTPALEASWAGAEANVAVGLARFGEKVSFVTVVPDNALGQALIAELRRHGVETSSIVRGGDRLGVYFVEAGSNQRPTRVVYDRAHSALAEAGPGTIDFDAVLKGHSWFHISGITPAISASACGLAMQALAAAGRHGLTVSLDLNLRTALWKWGRDCVGVFREMMPCVDLLIANEGHLEKCLGMTRRVDEDAFRKDPRAYRALVDEVFQAWPRVARILVTVRRTVSADHQGIGAVLADREHLWASPFYEVRDIVDRIGTGDAMTAGLIYGLNRLADESTSVNFAAAAACLSHSIPGDFPRFSTGEVQELMEQAVGGRDQR